VHDDAFNKLSQCFCRSFTGARELMAFARSFMLLDMHRANRCAEHSESTGKLESRVHEVARSVIHFILRSLFLNINISYNFKSRTFEHSSLPLKG
jgi:hypothetical protein